MLSYYFKFARKSKKKYLKKYFKNFQSFCSYKIPLLFGKYFNLLFSEKKKNYIKFVSKIFQKILKQF